MIINVFVVPNSRKFSISTSKDGRVKIYLKNEPENNKANIELITKLSKLLCRDVKLLFGHLSKHKKLSVDITGEEWLAFLQAQA